MDDLLKGNFLKEQTKSQTHKIKKKSTIFN